MKPLRLLLLIDSFTRGGKERRLMELIKGLTKTDGLEPALIIMSDRIQYPEIRTLGVPVTTMVRKSNYDPLQFWRLYQYCRTYQPDVIHSWGSMSSIYAIPVAQLLGIKLISGNIADAPRKMSWRNKRHLWIRLAFPFADRIVGNSQAGLKAYGAPSAKRHCIYNGFDFNRLQDLEQPSAVRTKLGLQAGKTVGMIGAFHPRKDYETFIRAAILLLEEGRPVNFLAIGDGPDKASCQAQVPEAFHDRILFPGLVQQVESMIQLFDIGVLCTNAAVHGEGISNAILEYMALGKPVVATEGGGTPEVILDGATGLLVDAGRPAQLAEKIAYLLDHPAAAKAMGERGRERVASDFSLPRMTQGYTELYQELITP